MSFYAFYSAMLIRILFVVLFLNVFQAQAQEIKTPFNETGFQIPRFVSLRSDKVYARTGPGKEYPIRYIYQRKNLPVEVTLEYLGWRKIRDQQGAEGWVHNTLLSGKRNATIDIEQFNIKIRKNPNQTARATALVENNAIVRIEKCIKNNWCQVSSAGYKGWIQRKNLWGVYQNEFFDQN